MANQCNRSPLGALVNGARGNFGPRMVSLATMVTRHKRQIVAQDLAAAKEEQEQGESGESGESEEPDE